MQLAEKNSEILQMFDDLVGLTQLGSLPKNCDHCRFFEVISEQTSVHGIKAQKILANLKNNSKKRLITRLETLGLDYAKNGDDINEAELQLGKIVDAEIRERLEDYRVFEILHAERSSPHFLDICKKTVQSDNISDICNEKGEKLMSRADLELYITNFYKSLYRFDDTVQGEIDDFLGPDVLNHPLVRGSILTDEEKIKLDRELCITELDSALEQSNFKSSPGVDGFSYKYIKKILEHI